MFYNLENVGLRRRKIKQIPKNTTIVIEVFRMSFKSRLFSKSEKNDDKKCVGRKFKVLISLRLLGIERALVKNCSHKQPKTYTACICILFAFVFVFVFIFVSYLHLYLYLYFFAYVSGQREGPGQELLGQTTQNIHSLFFIWISFFIFVLYHIEILGMERKLVKWWLAKYPKT